MKHFYFSVLFVICAMTTSAQVIDFPDANFKTLLLAASQTNTIARNQDGIACKIDTNEDGEIEQSEAALIYWIDVSRSATTPDIEKIADIQGIQSFLNLHNLICTYNLLATIDVATLPLINLYCAHNQLTQLNVGSGLHHLICSYNLLTEIDTTQFPNIMFFDCSNNQLSHLALACENLDALFCNNNQLVSLAFSEMNLMGLNCSCNQLAYLDITSCGNFSDLDMMGFINLSNNPLETLRACTTQYYSGVWNITNIPDLQHIFCLPINNNQFQYHLNQAGYSNCQIEDACSLSIVENIQPKFYCYPNPATNELSLNFSSSVTLTLINIYNLLGQLVLAIPNAQQISTIDVSDLKSGSYFINVISDRGSSTGKFIKE